MSAANTAEIGIVNTQAQTKFTVTPQRTAETLLVIPTPKTVGTNEKSGEVIK